MNASSLSAVVSRLSSLDSAGLRQLAGWTMLHFLWIGGLIAVVAVVLRLALRRVRPQVRYLAAVAMLAVFAAAPVAIAAWLVQVRNSEFGIGRSRLPSGTSTNGANLTSPL